MGIARFHKFIKSKCNSSKQCIKQIDINDMRNMTVAIDSSIFMYQFKRKDKLIPNIFHLCSLFRDYNITPIFVFDGKPCHDKQDIIDHRRNKREKYYKEFTKLMESYEKQQEQIEFQHENENEDEDEHQNINCNQVQDKDILDKINYYKSKCVRITKEDIQHTKKLLDLYGITWVQCIGEADVVCALLCKKKYVDAVISDDTDMFAFGCQYIIRNFTLLTRKATLYNMNHILKQLDINEMELKRICMLAHNDYNTKTKINFVDILKDEEYTYTENINENKNIHGKTNVNGHESECKSEGVSKGIKKDIIVDIHKKRFLDIFDIYHQFKHEDNILNRQYMKHHTKYPQNWYTSLFDYIKYAVSKFSILQHGNIFDIRHNKYINQLSICIPEIKNKNYNRTHLIQFLNQYHFYI